MANFGLVLGNAMSAGVNTYRQLQEEQYLQQQRAYQANQMQQQQALERDIANLSNTTTAPNGFSGSPSDFGSYYRGADPATLANAKTVADAQAATAGATKISGVDQAQASTNQSPAAPTPATGVPMQANTGAAALASGQAPSAPTPASGPRLSQTAPSIAQQGMDYFTGQGLTRAQAAGIVGNQGTESGFNPTAADGTGSFGLGQWRGSRLAALRQFAQANGRDVNDALTQDMFTMQELRGSQSAAYRRLQAAPDDPTAAADAFTAYERPQGYTPNGPASNVKFIGRREAGARAAMGLPGRNPPPAVEGANIDTGAPMVDGSGVSGTTAGGSASAPSGPPPAATATGQSGAGLPSGGDANPSATDPSAPLPAAPGQSTPATASSASPPWAHPGQLPATADGLTWYQTPNGDLRWTAQPAQMSEDDRDRAIQQIALKHGRVDLYQQLGNNIIQRQKAQMDLRMQQDAYDLQHYRTTLQTAQSFEDLAPDFNAGHNGLQTKVIHDTEGPGATFQVFNNQTGQIFRTQHYDNFNAAKGDMAQNSQNLEAYSTWAHQGAQIDMMKPYYSSYAALMKAEAAKSSAFTQQGGVAAQIAAQKAQTDLANAQVTEAKFRNDTNKQIMAIRTKMADPKTSPADRVQLQGQLSSLTGQNQMAWDKVTGDNGQEISMGIDGNKGQWKADPLVGIVPFNFNTNGLAKDPLIGQQILSGEIQPKGYYDANNQLRARYFVVGDKNGNGYDTRQQAHDAFVKIRGGAAGSGGAAAQKPADGPPGGGSWSNVALGTTGLPRLPEGPPVAGSYNYAQSGGIP